MLQFQNFFNWVLKCTKILLQEPIDQVQQANRLVRWCIKFTWKKKNISLFLNCVALLTLSLSPSELVVVFLKFLFQSDPVEQLLDAKCSAEVDM
jgi:anaphase-promoting complex subunit 4